MAETRGIPIPHVQPTGMTSAVPNSANVKSGDLVFVRDVEGLLGVAVVEQVTARSGTKELLRCPVCGRSGFRERTNMSPPFRCFSGHIFDEPKREVRDVTLLRGALP